MISEQPNPHKYAERWKLPGFTIELTGLDPAKTRHVQAVLKIEKSLATRPEFSDVEKNPTEQSMQRWLHDVHGNVDAITFRTHRSGTQSPQEILQGVIVEQTAIGVAAKNAQDQVIDYVYLYRKSEQEKAGLATAGLPDQKSASGKPKQMLELSFTDTQASYTHMSEAVLQVATKVMQRIAKNSNPDGNLTSEELARTNDGLILFAQTGIEAEESGYRATLVNAGARLVGVASDDVTITAIVYSEQEASKASEGKENMNYVYVFEPELVQKKLREKQQSL